MIGGPSIAGSGLLVPGTSPRLPTCVPWNRNIQAARSSGSHMGSNGSQSHQLCVSRAVSPQATQPQTRPSKECEQVTRFFRYISPGPPPAREPCSAEGQCDPPMRATHVILESKKVTFDVKRSR